MTPVATKRRPREGSSFRSWRRLARMEANGYQDVTPSRDDAFWRYLTSASPSRPEHVLEQWEQRALSKATDAAGGYLVPQDLHDQIVEALRAASAIVGVSNEIVTETGRTLLVPTNPTHGIAYWTAENAAITPSDEVFAQTSLGAHKSATKLIASRDLTEDVAIDFDAWLARSFGARFALLEDNAFLNGDGSGKPLGVLHATSAVTVVQAATGSATAFKLADVKAVWKALPAAYRPAATWLMHPDAQADLASLTDTAGALVLPSLQADPPTLFGRPALIAAALPAPAANAKSVVVGDWRVGYSIRRQRGIAMVRLDELHSDNDQLGYRGSERVDGKVAVADALRILQHSAT
jgi:HK97 family phage major capsid protein